MEPEVGVRKVAESGAEGSVVLQCGSEDGEVVSGYGSRVGELTAALQTYSKMAVRALGCEEEEDAEEVSESRSALRRGGRIDSGYGSSRARRRRSGEPTSTGEDLVVAKAPVKRKHEDDCGPGSESVLYEDTDSASPSDSDSEYEHWSRRATSRKRSGSGEESMFTTEESLQRESVICDSDLKEMQQLLELQLQASERREAGMKQYMEAMMEMMSRHMGHVERRVCTLEVGVQPHDQALERINLKLEKVMEGFATLNENLSLLSACLSQGLD